MKEYTLILIADEGVQQWTYVSDNMGSLYEFMEEIREGEFHNEGTFVSLLEVDSADAFIEVIEIRNIPDWWYELLEKTMIDTQFLDEQVLDTMSIVTAWKAFDLMVTVCYELDKDLGNVDLVLLEKIESNELLAPIRDEASFIVKTSSVYDDIGWAVLRKLEVLGAGC